MAKLFQCRSITCAHTEKVGEHINPDCTRFCPKCQTKTMRHVSGDEALQHMKNVSELAKLNQEGKL